jgi:hypothetical protein
MDGHLRIGFGKEPEDLDEGLARIAALADPLTA